MTKTILRERAIKLRKEGFSYNFIRDQIKVSKGTLSRWLSHLPFKPGSEFILKVNRTHDDLRDRRRKHRLESEQEARSLAQGDLSELSARDLYLLGLGIYMGEGSRSKNFRLVSSDPAIIKIGIEWLRKIYGVPDERIMVRVHIYPESNAEESRSYWQKVSGLKPSQFYPVLVNKGQKAQSSSRRLLFGTAHITIRSGGVRAFGVLLTRRILNTIEIAKSKASNIVV